MNFFEGFVAARMIDLKFHSIKHRMKKKNLYK